MFDPSDRSSSLSFKGTVMDHTLQREREGERPSEPIRAEQKTDNHAFLPSRAVSVYKVVFLFFFVSVQPQSELRSV